MPLDELPEIESIFDEAVLIDDADARSRFVARCCAGDSSLIQRVEALLRAYEKGEYLEATAVDLFHLGATVPELVGQRVGDYEVLEWIGEGGTGEVYLARELLPPHGEVAVKFLKVGMDLGHILARFKQEGDLLKLLRHPNIAHYVSSGVTTAGRAFVAMEVVRGLPITEYCDRHVLTIDDRLRLMVEVCAAVDWAHHRGIVHRDLKPTNILVERRQGRPRIKIIDFGIAKVLDDPGTLSSQVTQVSQLLGTPAYMSPEQYSWSSDVDAQSDVYALGVILQELLVGQTPLTARMSQQRDLELVRQMVLRDAPLRSSQVLQGQPPEDRQRISQLRNTDPSTLAARLRGGLDWIVLASLSIDRSRRYASAAQLAEELTAHLEHRPTLAGPPDWVSRLGGWVRRRSKALVGLAVVVLLLLTVPIGWRVQHDWRSLKNLNASAIDQQRVIQSQLDDQAYAIDLRNAEAALQAGNDQAATAILDKYRLPELKPQFDTFALHYLSAMEVTARRSPLDHTADVLDMDCSPNQRWLATCDQAGEIVISELDDQSIVTRLHPSQREVTRVRFSPDGSWLASTGQDQRLRIWNTATWQPAWVRRCRDVTVNGLVWSPDGRYVVTGDRNGQIIVWDARNGDRFKELVGQGGRVRAVDWSANGHYLAATDENRILVWSTQDWQLQSSFDAPDGVLEVAFAPDSRTLVCGGYFRELLIIDLQIMQIVQRLLLPLGAARTLGFSRQRDLVVGLNTGSLRYYAPVQFGTRWNFVRESQLTAKDDLLRRVIYRNDRDRLLAVCQQQRELIEVSASAVSGYRPVACSQPVVGLLPDLGLQVSYSRQARMTRLKPMDDSSTDVSLPIVAEVNCRPEFHPQAQLLAIAGEDGQGPCIGLFDLPTFQARFRIPVDFTVHQMCFSPDGSRLIVNGIDEQSRLGVPLRIVTTASGEMQPYDGTLIQGQVRCAFAPNADFLVTGELLARKMHCLDANTLRHHRTLQLSSGFYSLKYDPYGRFLMVGDANRLSCYAPDLSQLWWSSASSSGIHAIEIAPDQRLVACLCHDGVIRLWDLVTREQLFDLAYHPPGPLHADSTFWIAMMDPATLFFGGGDRPELIRLGARLSR